MTFQSSSRLSPRAELLSFTRSFFFSPFTSWRRYQTHFCSRVSSEQITFILPTLLVHMSPVAGFSVATPQHLFIVLKLIVPCSSRVSPMDHLELLVSGALPASLNDRNPQGQQ